MTRGSLFEDGVAAVVDTLAISRAFSSGTVPFDALIVGIRTGFSDVFDGIARRAATAAASALLKSSVRINSHAGRVAEFAARRSAENMAAEFYKLIAGSVVVSARLLDRLAVETGRDPNEILREIAQEIDHG